MLGDPFTRYSGASSAARARYALAVCGKAITFVGASGAGRFRHALAWTWFSATGLPDNTDSTQVTYSADPAQRNCAPSKLISSGSPAPSSRDHAATSVMIVFSRSR